MKTNFESAYERIKQTAGIRTQTELADILNIRQSSISDAKRRDSIPEAWLVKLWRKYQVNPDWIEYGRGSQYLVEKEEDDEKSLPFIGPDFLTIHAVSYFDTNNRLRKLQEEMSELSTAISHYVDGRLGAVESLKSEYADVESLMWQVRFIIGDKDLLLYRVAARKKLMAAMGMKSEVTV